MTTPYGFIEKEDNPETYLVVDGVRYTLEYLEKHIMANYSDLKDEWYQEENIMYHAVFQDIIASLKKKDKLEDWIEAVKNGETQSSYEDWKEYEA